MYEDVTAFCDACAICDTLAKPNRQFVLEHEIATEPFEILSMDLVKLGEGQWKFMLTIMDVFSRYGFGIPIKNKQSDTVMKAYLDSHITLFGFPRNILTDRGKEFLTKLALEVYKSLNINKLSTTAYSPNGNPVERIQRELIAMIVKFMTETGQKWKKV